MMSGIVKTIKENAVMSYTKKIGTALITDMTGTNAVADAVKSHALKSR
jgi:hypothetical protein